MKIRADRRVGLLLGGVVLLTFAALGTTVALPAAEPTLNAKPRDLSRLEARGMHVFRSEGCWTCHTGYVRSSSVDSNLGDPLDPKAYAGMSPSMLGLERIGPDLTNVAGRYADAKTLIAYLEDPGSPMPSYGYLSEDDLNALAAYLLSRGG